MLGGGGLIVRVFKKEGYSLCMEICMRKRQLWSVIVDLLFFVRSVYSNNTRKDVGVRSTYAISGK